MPSFKYVIELSDADRAELNDVISKGTSPARTILRANILLASDRSSKKYMTVAEIADVYHTTPTTVQTVRTSYCEKGLAATLARKKRETPPVPAKVTGDVEARIIALVCGTPPEGYSKWTLRLLANKTVELGYIIYNEKAPVYAKKYSVFFNPLPSIRGTGFQEDSDEYSCNCRSYH